MSKIQIFYTVLLILITVSGQETEDQSSGKYEYMQIFRNIPRLFEYFLSRLAEKPEVLENDDITVFIRSADIQEKAKREAHCSVIDRFIVNDKCDVKRATDLAVHDLSDESVETVNEIKKKSDLQHTLYMKQVESLNENNVKRESNIDTNKIINHQCHNKDDKNCNPDNYAKRDVVNRTYEFNANIETPRKKYNISHGKTRGQKESNINKIKNVVDKPNNFRKKVHSGKDNREALDNKNPKKYNRRSSDDFRVFRFSPEDLEETILMAEKMLEEHYEKQMKKV